MRITKYISLGFALLLLGNISCKEKVEEKIVEPKNERPNIIIVLCDDLGYSDVGFNGSTDILTPALDKLASNGTVFSSAYVAHPFCGPSRAGLMTGRYPHKIGSQFNLPPNDALIRQGIPTEEIFISKMLKDNGYYTGAIGKWHLGSVPQYHPNVRGFDDFYGFLGGGHKYFPDEYRETYEKQLKSGKEVINDYITPLEHNGKEVRETEYLTDALSREASRFVKDASKKEEPFFLYLAYNAPHVPLEAKKEDLEKFAHIKDEKRRTYAAMVHAVDRGVAGVVETLKNTGEFDNTLIVFLSDNGGKLTQGGRNTPLREGKGSTCEGGYRVPMLFHWPKGVAAGKEFEHPTSALDFYPTFAGLAGATLPDGKQLDGKDIWKEFVKGENPRKGENIYALRHRTGYSDVGVRKDQWKALKLSEQPWALYNIQEDMGELNDLSSAHPEVLKNLITEAEAWSQSNKQPLWFHSEEEGELWREMDMPKFDIAFETE